LSPQAIYRVHILFFALAIFLPLLLHAAPASAPAPERVIIDTDPGTDDALAILLALNSPELRVEALTIVAGNVPAAVGLDNALKVASLAGAAISPSPKAPRARFMAA
jgi:inosine-uridine preferring nucleoside hydrolase